MELALGLVALIVAAVALGGVLWLRSQVRELRILRHDLEQTQRELAELKAATEIVPAPPLPKTRPASLDDLREQLRAAHREGEDKEQD